MATSRSKSPFKDPPRITAQDLKNPSALVTKIEALREQVQLVIGTRGDVGFSALVAQILRDSGDLGGGGGVPPGGGVDPGPGTDPTPDLTPPPTPTGFDVDAAISHIFSSSDNPTYTMGHGHDVSVLYGAKRVLVPLAPAPVFSDAVNLVEYQGAFFAYPSDPATRWHLWLKWRTKDGVESLVPAGGTNGLVTETAVDVEKLLEALTGEITESQLYLALQGRIDLIDGPNSMPGSVNARVKTETDARVLADSAIASDVTSLTAQFVASGRNLALNSSFEMDSDADGRADDWRLYNVGTSSGRTFAQDQGRQVGLSQKCMAASLGSGTGDRHGAQVWISLTPNQVTQVRASAYVRGTVGTSVGIQVFRVTAGVTGTSTSTILPLTSTWMRIDVLAGVTSANDEIRVSVFQCQDTTGGAVELFIDDVLVQPGNVLNPYEPGVGDIQTSQAAIVAERVARAAGDVALATDITTLTAQFAASGKNLIKNSSFELDTDGNGVADEWVANGAGTSGTVTRQQAPGRITGVCQQSSSNGLGNTINDGHGFYQNVDIAPGQMTTAQCSAWMRGQLGTKLRIAVQRYNGGSLLGSTTIDVACTGDWQRVNRGTTVEPLCNQLRVFYQQRENGTGGVATLDLDDAQVEAGTYLSEYTPGMGDFLLSFAAVRNEAMARASADVAIASDVLTVQAEIANVGTNAVLNSSFEADTDTNGLADNWATQTGGTVGAIVRSITDGRTTDTKAQRMTASGMGTTTNDWIQVMQDTPVVPNTSIFRTLSAWVKCTPAGTPLGCIAGQYAGGAYTGPQTVSGFTPSTGDWQRISVIVPVLAAGTDAIRISFRARQRATVGAVALDVDDAQLEEGDKLHAYQPGTGEAQALYAAVRVEALARAATDGSLLAQYTVKVDVAGLVAGYGLAATAVDGVPTSAFGVRANRFWLAPPSVAQSTAPTTNLYDGFCWLDTSTAPDPTTRYYRASTNTWVLESPVLPFVVQVTPTTINGVPVPPGIYANDAYFKNGTITNAKIGNLAVDDAKIAYLSASKLRAGTVDVGEYIQSTSFVAGVSGWRINGDGTAFFNNVVIRGGIYATYGFIGGAEITGTYVQSTNYVAGTSGWRLSNSTGQILAYAGVIGGAVITSTGIQSTNFNASTLGWKIENSTGKLWAMSAQLGQWVVDATSLRLVKGSYADTANGLWQGLDGGVPKLNLGNSTDYLRWTGSELQLSKPIFNEMSATINAGDSTVTVPGDSQNFKLVYLGTRSVASVVGGRAPYSYQWMAVPQVASSAGSADYSLTGGLTSTCNLYAYGTGSSHQKIFRLLCLITDANGRVTTVGATITANLSALDG